MKLRSHPLLNLNEIGFGDRISKSVDDVSADKFEDFGVYVGQLYQKFQKKDISADPAIAQKIMDLVSDDEKLMNQVKDLEFLVNQLPDRPEPKGKIGFKESLNEGIPFPQTEPNEFAYIDFKKWAYSNRKFIRQDLSKYKDTSIFKRLVFWWEKWDKQSNQGAFSNIKPNSNFGRKLAIMMKNDDVIFSKEAWEKNNKITNLKGANKDPYSDEHPNDSPPDDKGIEEIDALHENEEYCPKCVSKMKEVIKESIEKIIEKEKPGLWANIRAKRARVGKKGMAKKGSEAYKTAKKAGDKINKDVDEAKTKPAKGKRFAKKVKGKGGRTRTVSYGQSGKAKKGGDRIRPGTKKGHAYCARSAKIKKCKNPPCANTLSRKKWKCKGSRSVPE